MKWTIEKSNPPSAAKYNNKAQLNLSIFNNIPTFNTICKLKAIVLVKTINIVILVNYQPRSEFLPTCTITEISNTFYSIELHGNFIYLFVYLTFSLNLINTFK